MRGDCRRVFACDPISSLARRRCGAGRLQGRPGGKRRVNPGVCRSHLNLPTVRVLSDLHDFSFLRQGTDGGSTGQDSLFLRARNGIVTRTLEISARPQIQEAWAVGRVRPSREAKIGRVGRLPCGCRNVLERVTARVWRFSFFHAGFKGVNFQAARAPAVFCFWGITDE